MNTETKISAVAYDVELIDLRTHEHLTDRIVLEVAWLRVLNKVDISDHDYLAMTYAKQGYILHKMNTRRRVTLVADLMKLYARAEALADTGTANSQTFANLEGRHG